MRTRKVAKPYRLVAILMGYAGRRTREDANIIMDFARTINFAESTDLF